MESQSVCKWWDFDTRILFQTTKYIVEILNNIEDACKVKKEFMILGPDLKAVTGSSTHVDEKAA